MGTHKPNPTLQRLSVFIGKWTWVASIDGSPFGNGRSVFEWMEGGAFLLLREDADQPDFPSGTIIVGGDEDTGTYSWLQTDSRGSCRVYQMSLEDGVWKYWRNAPGFLQRFMGTFSSDGKTITGRVEQSSDGSLWIVDFDLTYTKSD